MTPETKLKEQIKRYLDAIGALHWPYVNTGRGIAGFPDRFGVYKGRFFAIEAKSPGKKPTKFQDLILTRILAHGGIAIVAWTVDDVRAAFEPAAEMNRRATSEWLKGRLGI